MKRKSNNRKYKFDYLKFVSYVLEVALLIGILFLVESIFRVIETVGGTTVRYIIGWGCIIIYIVCSSIQRNNK